MSSDTDSSESSPSVYFGRKWGSFKRVKEGDSKWGYGYFEGDWVKGTMTSGKWVWKDGTCYQGQFGGNKPKGQGVWTFGKENGNMQVGNFVADGKWRSDLVRFKPSEDDEAPADEEGAAKPAPAKNYWKGGRLSQLNP